MPTPPAVSSRRTEPVARLGNSTRAGGRCFEAANSGRVPAEPARKCSATPAGSRVPAASDTPSAAGAAARRARNAERATPFASADGGTIGFGRVGLRGRCFQPPAAARACGTAPDQAPTPTKASHRRRRSRFIDASLPHRGRAPGVSIRGIRPVRELCCATCQVRRMNRSPSTWETLMSSGLIMRPRIDSRSVSESCNRSWSRPANLCQNRGPRLRQPARHRRLTDAVGARDALDRQPVDDVHVIDEPLACAEHAQGVANRS